MTIWKAGMLAVCVGDDRRFPCRPLRSPEPLKRGKIYRILWVGVVEGYSSLQVQESDVIVNGCWLASNFRPLNDAADDTDLIAKIKNCRPARIPEPVSSGAPLRARKATGGGSHSSSGRSLHTQAGNDLLNDNTQLNSFNHGESV